MSGIRIPKPVNLIVGIIFTPDAPIDEITDLLIERFGAVALASDVMPFDGTDYYAWEMGEGLKRRFLSFEELVRPEALPDFKLATNDIETKYARKNTDGAARRIVNLDPGYITPAKLVLATTKDFGHRIYIGKGIFAETTLRFVGKTFVPFEFTYPDYRTDEYIEYFIRARDIYMDKMRERGYLCK